jgi:hypothetical protein
MSGPSAYNKSVFRRAMADDPAGYHFYSGTDALLTRRDRADGGGRFRKSLPSRAIGAHRIQAPSQLLRGCHVLARQPSANPESTMSSSLAEAAKGIYVTGLRNQHAVENQAIELLERQVGRLENYPEMEARMRRHIEESREQTRRLEDLLAQYDTSHSSLKDAAMSLVGNMAALGHSTAPDEVLKNTLANFAFEHYEIAS